MTRYHFGVQCVECKKRMFSYFTHDFKKCGCKNETFVDGGRDYLRFGWAKIQPKRIRWTKRLDGQ